jgi:hypothetical protein
MSKPAATAAAPAVKVLSETDAKTVLLNYINDQNRPYSVIQLHDNLHGSIPRTRLQQLLDRFVADDTIKCKVFGKSQIYFAVQGDEPLPQDELDTMDEQIETMTATLNQKRAENKTLSAGSTIIYLFWYLCFLNLKVFVFYSSQLFLNWRIR